MDRCKLCNNQFLKFNAIDHMKQCPGQSLHQFRQLSKRQKTDIKLHCTLDHCFLCDRKYSAKFFFDHFSEHHQQSTYLIRRLMKEINISSEDAITYCIICGEEFLWSVVMNHLEKRHMENIPMLLEVSKQMAVPHSQHGNCKICDTLFAEDESIANVSEYEDILLIHQLTDRLKSTFDNKMSYSTMVTCAVCSEESKVSMFVDHLAQRHPGTIHIMQKLKANTHVSGNRYCQMCGQLVLDIDPMDHFRNFHPKSMIMFQQISAKLETESESCYCSMDESDPDANQIIDSQREVSIEFKKQTYVSWLARQKKSSAILKRAQISIKRAMLYKKPHAYVIPWIARNKNSSVIQKRAIIYKKTSPCVLPWVARKKKSSVIQKQAQLYLKRAMLYKKPSYVIPWIARNKNSSVIQKRALIYKKTSPYVLSWIARKKKSSLIQKLAQLYLKRAMIYKKTFPYVFSWIARKKNSSVIQKHEMYNKTSYVSSWIARRKNLSVIQKRAQFYLKRAMIYKKPSYINSCIHKNQNKVETQIEVSASDIHVLSKSIDLQPIVKLERLPPYIYQEYIRRKNELRQVCGPYIHYLVRPQENASFIPISGDTEEELNERELNNSQNSEADYPEVVVPGEISKLTRQCISDSHDSCNLPKDSILDPHDASCNLPKESNLDLHDASYNLFEDSILDLHDASCSKESISYSHAAAYNLFEDSILDLHDASGNLPKDSISVWHDASCIQPKESILDSQDNLWNLFNESPSSLSAELIQQGVKEQNRAIIKKARALNAMRRKALKKIKAKTREKEAKKLVLYRQKGLTKYVTQKQDTLAKFEGNLINARKYATNQKMRKELLKELNSIENVKIRQKVTSLLQELFVAMNKVPSKKRRKAKKLCL